MKKKFRQHHHRRSVFVCPEGLCDFTYLYYDVQSSLQVSFAPDRHKQNLYFIAMY
jgi:hypothetical protein